RRNDPAGPTRTIAKIGRNDQHPRAAHLHALHPFVPAADDVTCAERECERLAAVLARVELAAGLAVLVQPAGVVHAHMPAGVGFVAAAHYGVAVLEAGRGGLVGHRVDSLWSGKGGGELRAERL